MNIGTGSHRSEQEDGKNGLEANFYKEEREQVLVCKEIDCSKNKCGVKQHKIGRSLLESSNSVSRDWKWLHHTVDFIKECSSFSLQFEVAESIESSVTPDSSFF